MIIEDTRQKQDKHNVKHKAFDDMGIKILRCTLPFGDYSYPPKIAVDTKENMQEIAANLVGDHARFRSECIRAQVAGCHLYILVETEWEDIKTVDDVHLWFNPRLIYSSKAVTGEKIEKIMKTMQTKYGVRFLFCRPEDSAATIIKILDGDYENGQSNSKCSS